MELVGDTTNWKMIKAKILLKHSREKKRKKEGKEKRKK